MRKKTDVIMRRMSQGSMTVEAAYLIPMAVLLTALLIFYCFYEHDRVWFTSAACETALVGTRRTESGEDAQILAEERAQERIRSQPFPVGPPDLKVTADKKNCSVGFESAGKTAFRYCLPYRVKEQVEKADPVGRIRTAWIVKKCINGG